MRAAELIGTVGGVGYLRPAPGTWGSLAGLVLAYVLYVLGGLWVFVLAIPLVFAAGWWATIRMTEGSENHDPSEIVVDEVAGQWVALLPVIIGAAHVGVPVLSLWPGWIVAFFGFRLFDILKPGPVGWADRRDDPLGVMLDDVIAGLLAAVVVALAGILYHVFLI
ncbi:phosphatidylglycerophosphatase A family protein [Pseudooceanicola sp.]|uniref:phosphatidylglycerophosphatase A family protein n=1 Tax=Pseudooceanicola sp. TaxID=1914328 RepID=UPI004058027D